MTKNMEIVVVREMEKHFQILHNSADNYSISNRINTFTAWCIDNRTIWMNANLADYRDHLLNEHGLAPSSVEAHLSTLRQRIRDVLYNNDFYDYLLASHQLEGESLADVNARIQMIKMRIDNMINPRHSSVKVVKKQDIADSERLWLNGHEEEFIQAVIANSKHPEEAERNEAIARLLLDTGLRLQELCNLVVSDLSESLGGHPALLVRRGKGNKQRLIPYGELTQGRDLALAWADKWGLAPSAPLFQGFWHGFTSLRRRKMATRPIRYILSIPISIGTPSPHDLRRTYARKMYLEPFKMQIEAIQANMGHENRRVTEEYIGDIEIISRLPRIR